MPLDKSKHGNANHTNRPLMPTLAASRPVKPPITPRLAAAAVSVTSPSSRDVNRLDITPAAAANSFKSALSRDESSTPGKVYLSGNITPRSATRKSRVDSSNTTPNGTPTTTATSTTGWASSAKEVSRPETSFGRVASPGLVGGNQYKRPASVIQESSSVGNSPLIRAATFTPQTRWDDSASGPNFFHVSEVGCFEPAIPLKKQLSFFYANGQKEDLGTTKSTRVPASPASPPLSIVSGKSQQKSQFYRADGTLESEFEAPSLPPHPSPPTNASSPDVLGQIGQREAISSPFSLRPPSPQKSSIHLSYRKGASQIISPSNRPTPLNVVTSVNTGTSSPGQSSQEKDPFGNHARTASLGSIDTSNSSRKSSVLGEELNPLGIIHGIGSPTNSIKSSSPFRLPQPPTSNPAGPMQPLENCQQSSNVSQPTLSWSLPQSPVHQPKSSVNLELAANARRERKVLDLEISNSSLLAINRQLEREVRRQRTELRRFRRLSRAGRLSNFSKLSGQDYEHPDDPKSTLSDLGGSDEYSDSEDDSEEDEDIDSSLSSDSIDESTLSHEALLKRDATKLAKDEKRLQLDLSKHKQLLIDSQKMNQSLKRCMTWTEEMISEARRALEYRVRVSDVKLGGRVLERDDLEHITEVDGEDDALERKGLLGCWNPPTHESSTAVSAAHDEFFGSPIDSSTSVRREDRDSGVDIEQSPPPFEQKPAFSIHSSLTDPLSSDLVLQDQYQIEE